MRIDRRRNEELAENLSTTNPTWPDLSSKPGRHGGKPVTNRLSYGAAKYICFELLISAKDWPCIDRCKLDGFVISSAGLPNIFTTEYVPLVSWESWKIFGLVGTATGFRLDGRGLILGRSKRFFFSPQRPGWLWGPPSLLTNIYRGKAAGTWRLPLTI
jgi:hypothetical protein